MSPKLPVPVRVLYVHRDGEFLFVLPGEFFHRRMKMLQKFMDQFGFTSGKSMYVGIERESFLVKDGRISPIAPLVLARLPDRVRFGYELSACQLEDRVGPTKLNSLRGLLAVNDRDIALVGREMRFSRSFCEVGPIDMPLDVYPDPTGRYQDIVRNISKKTLLAACRVIGTHVHIGMPDHATALRVYDEVASYWRELARMGDGSSNRRLDIYQQMAGEFEPIPYGTWEAFHRQAMEKGFEHDPRKCWRLIRISVHGTIEFRMFGATSELDRVVTWARRCHELCRSFI